MLTLIRYGRLAALTLLGGALLAGCWQTPRILRTDDGLQHYREGTIERFGTADGLPDETVTAIAINGPEVWIGTEKGVAVYNRQTKQWTTHTRSNSRLPHNEITALARDTRGRIWIGTSKRGVVRVSRLNWDLYDSGNELPGSIVTAIYAEPSGHGLDDDNVWIGTTRGLARYNADGWVTYQSPALFSALQDDGMMSDEVDCLAGDDSFLWMGCAKGVGRFNDVNWKKWSPEGGFDLERMEFLGPDRYPIKEDEISCLAYDGKEYLYVAARRAQIASFDGAVWGEVPIERGCDIKAMLAFPDGELWVSRYNSLGTFSDLRRRVPGTDQWQVLTTADGLPSNQVTCLVAEGRDLWIGTTNGVAHLIRPQAPAAQYTRTADTAAAPQ